MWAWEWVGVVTGELGVGAWESPCQMSPLVILEGWEGMSVSMALVSPLQLQGRR